MKRIHVLAVSLLLALAAALGVLAASRTAHLGSVAAARPRLAGAAITLRARRLERIEASLRRARADRPPPLPALPPLPKASAVRVAQGAPAPAPAFQAPRVVYRRPAPIVVIKHRSGESDSADSSDHEGDGGGDD
jgi:hypothetical protein